MKNCVGLSSMRNLLLIFLLLFLTACGGGGGGGDDGSSNDDATINSDVVWNYQANYQGCNSYAEGTWIFNVSKGIIKRISISGQDYHHDCSVDGQIEDEFYMNETIASYFPSEAEFLNILEEMDTENIYIYTINLYTNDTITFEALDIRDNSIEEWQITHLSQDDNDTSDPYPIVHTFNDEWIQLNTEFLPSSIVEMEAFSNRNEYAYKQVNWDGKSDLFISSKVRALTDFSSSENVYFGLFSNDFIQDQILAEYYIYLTFGYYNGTATRKVSAHVPGYAISGTSPPSHEWITYTLKYSYEDQLIEIRYSGDNGNEIWTQTFENVNFDNLPNDLIIGFFSPSLSSLDSSRDQVIEIKDTVVSFGINTNFQPLAILRNNINCTTFTNVEINGEDSFDPDGDILKYKWKINSKPNLSNATLLYDETGFGSNSTNYLELDVAGEYIVELQVSDGTLYSEPQTIKVTASYDYLTFNRYWILEDGAVEKIYSIDEYLDEKIVSVGTRDSRVSISIYDPTEDTVILYKTLSSTSGSPISASAVAILSETDILVGGTISDYPASAYVLKNNIVTDNIDWVYNLDEVELSMPETVSGSLIAPNGDILICGVAKYNTGYQGEFERMYIQKINASGVYQDGRTFIPDGAEQDIHTGAYSLCMTSDGNFLLAGNSKYTGSILGGVDPEFWQQQLLYLVKLDGDFNLIWESYFPTGSDDKINYVSENINHDIIIAGDNLILLLDANGNEKGRSSLNGRISSGSICEDGGHLFAGGKIGSSRSQSYLVKTDKNGNVIWEHTYGGGYDDDSEIYYTVAEANDGGIIVGGHFAYHRMIRKFDQSGYMYHDNN